MDVADLIVSSVAPACFGAPQNPSVLPVEAREFYDAACGRPGTTPVTEAHVSVLDDIEFANLGSTHWFEAGKDGRFDPVRLHPCYVAACGSGPHTVELWTRDVVGEFELPVLLGWFAGAYLDDLGPGSTAPDVPAHCVRVPHVSMRDGDHSSSVLAEAVVELLTFTRASTPGMRFAGRLSSMRAYQLDAPLDAFGQLSVCSMRECVESTGVHTTGPFLPPVVDEQVSLEGLLVELVVRTSPKEL